MISTYHSGKNLSIHQYVNGIVTYGVFEKDEVFWNIMPRVSDREFTEWIVSNTSKTAIKVDEYNSLPCRMVTSDLSLVTEAILRFG